MVIYFLYLSYFSFLNVLIDRSTINLDLAPDFEIGDEFDSYCILASDNSESISLKTVSKPQPAPDVPRKSETIKEDSFNFDAAFDVS